MGRLRAALPLVGWLGSLVAGIVLFTQMGDGPLATPPITDPSAWAAWAAERDPVIAGVALIRLLVLALAWYLVGVTTVGLVARLLRLASLVRIADAMSGPVARHVLRQALGVSLAVGVVAASTGAGPRTAAPTDGGTEVATAVALDDAAATATARAVAMEDGPVTAAMAPLDDPAVDGVGDAETELMVGLPPALAVDDHDDAPADPTPDEREHEVAAGEHLWAIAEATVADATGGSPTDTQVHAYWEVLIEDNRDRLADPHNPDLIFPGQRLVLPDVAPAADA